MAPFPRVGWIISLKFTEHHNKAYRADSDTWEAVKEFVLPKSNAPGDLDVGDRYHVQVNKLNDNTVRVQNFNPGRNDQLLPSGTLVTKIEERSAESYSEGKVHSFPFIDTLRIYGKVPASVVSVPIIAVAPIDSYAVSDVSQYEWPDSGESVRVFMNQGNSRVRSVKHRYEFPIEQPAPVTGVGQVTARYEDRCLVGSIQQFESDQPEKGDIVSAELDHSRGENTAWFGKYEDRIQIGSYPPVSGTTQIRITQATPPLKGEIVEPPESMPEVGETAIARILGGQNSAYVKPERMDARISLENESQQGGRVTIEITEISESIKGKILSYEGTPSEGDIIPVDTSRGKAPVTAESPSTATPVRIEEDVLASGTIDVRVTGKDGILTGVVESYGDLLPEVGETVSANIDSGITVSTANPDFGSYIVYLEDAVDYEGQATVRITKIDDKIEGRIIERNPVTQSVGSDSGNSPFETENSMWNITRNKH